LIVEGTHPISFYRENRSNVPLFYPHKNTHTHTHTYRAAFVLSPIDKMLRLTANTGSTGLVDSPAKPYGGCLGLHMVRCVERDVVHVRKRYSIA
jgi:hypothetical protein